MERGQLGRFRTMQKTNCAKTIGRVVAWLLAATAAVCICGCSGLARGVRKVDYKGWKNCYEITNGSVKLVVVPQLAGRVMHYSLDRENIMWEDNGRLGQTLEDVGKLYHPGGMMLDIYPTPEGREAYTKLWVGPYRVEQTGRYALRATSPETNETGLRLEKTYTMDPDTGAVDLDLKIINISDRDIQVSHWTRTFSQAPTFAFFPVNPASRFPNGWIKEAGGANANQPDNPEQWMTHKGFMLLHYLGAQGQLTADSDAGWLAWARGRLVHAQRFSVDMSAKYALNDSTVSFFTPSLKRKPTTYMVELEALSPIKTIKPGESCVWRQKWILFRNDRAVASKDDAVELGNRLSARFGR